MAAALVASAAAAIAATVFALVTMTSRWSVLVAPLCAVAALQCGYLGGLLAASGVACANKVRQR